MTTMRYEWRRFWVPRDGTLVLDNLGFLEDPEAYLGSIANPSAVPLETLSAIGCRVLLGEPGMGKSTEFRSLVDQLRRTKGQETTLADWDLIEYGSEDRLVRDLFEGPAVSQWAVGTSRFQLLLDSLDECQLRIETVSAILANHIKQMPYDRLELTLVCRTAVWRRSLEEALKDLWGSEHVGVYELAPLRRKDVEAAAVAEGLPPDAFLQAVIERDVVPFATRPTTLQMLIREFDRHGGLPDSKVELYEEGCRVLCEEPDPSRRDAGTTGELTPDERLAVASRIAACTMFTNLAGVWLGGAGETPEGFVSIDDISGGTVEAIGSRVDASRTNIRETLGTGLFTSRGQDRLGWAHRSYAEFLVAVHCARNLTLRQTISLLAHSAAPSTLVPQLTQAAAWVSALDHEVFSSLVDTSPESIVFGDVSALAQQDRQRLVGSLLHVFEMGGLDDWLALGLSRRSLAHASLASQLRPLLTDSAKPLAARHLGVDIASGSVVRELADDLVNIALDEGEPLRLRAHAARAIGQLGQVTAIRALIPLAIGQVPGDTNNELQGAALLQVWPSHVQAADVMKALPPPPQGFVGWYWLFLHSEFAAGLSSDDLPEVLSWIATESSSRSGRSHSLDELMDSVMEKAWSHLEEEDGAAAFASAALARIDNRPTILRDRLGRNRESNPIAIDANKRQLVVAACVGQLAGADDLAVQQRLRDSSLMMAEDLAWMSDQLHDESSADKRRTWAIFMEMAFKRGDDAAFEVVYEASQTAAEVEERFRWILGPVELNSEKARHLKGLYEDQKKWSQQRDSRPVLEPPPETRVSNLLDQLEDGDLSAWWKLNLELTLESDSDSYGSDFEPDIRQMPGWKNSGVQVHERLLDAAHEYTARFDPGQADWSSNSYSHPTLSGYRALRLLAAVRPESLDDLDVDAWRRWASNVIGSFELMETGSGDRAPGTAVLKLAYAAHPSEVIATVNQLVDKDNSNHGRVFIARELTPIADATLCTALSGRLDDKSLKPEAYADLLEQLLSWECEQAVSFAKQLVAKPIPKSAIGKQRYVLTASRLFLLTAELAPWVLRTIQRRQRIHHDFLLAVASAPGSRSSSLQSLDEYGLADLYRTLATEFPYEDDLGTGVRWMGPLDEARDFRDRVLRDLRERGTWASVDALRQLANELPGLAWLSRVIHTAIQNTLVSTWEPLAPREIVAMTASPTSRYIQTAAQLLELVTEALERYQQYLHGPFSPVRALWDRLSSTRYRPVDEFDFSDHVALFLTREVSDKGVVINREVHITRTSRTDILVTAVRPSAETTPATTVVLVIEVKGCWNRELMTAMREQLVNRYMAQAQAEAGLYLCGTFTNPRWDLKDRRRDRCVVRSAEELGTELAEQALALSSQGRSVGSVVISAAFATSGA